MTFVDIRTRSLTFILTATIAVLTVGAAIGGHAQTTASTPKDAPIGALIETLGKTRTPSSAAISPDGTTVAWALRTREGSQIHLTDVADQTKEKIVGTGFGATGCGSSEPKWSPDGEWLAFVSDCTAKTEKPGQDQVFVWSKKTDKSKEMTHLVGGIDSLAWSPDGKTIGFLFVENATRSAGALAAMKPWAGVIGEDSVEVQRVYGVSVEYAMGAWLTPANLHVYEFSWAPFPGEIAFIAAAPPGENNWWVANLYTKALGPLTHWCKPNAACSYNGPLEGLHVSVVDPTRLSGPLHGLQIPVPRWSPNGSRIAFIDGLMSDQGSTGGDVYLIPATGGEPRDVTPGRDTSVAFIGWVSPEVLGI